MQAPGSSQGVPGQDHRSRSRRAPAAPCGSVTGWSGRSSRWRGRPPQPPAADRTRC